MKKGFRLGLLLTPLILLSLYMSCNVWMTGAPFPLIQKETLQHPQHGATWRAGGLQLGNGDFILIPGIPSTPSPLLVAAVSHGVEVNQAREVTGLVNVWHWCGNDPVRYDLVRVNIRDLVRFLNQPIFGTARDGETQVALAGPMKPGGSYTAHGWLPTEFAEFKRYQAETKEKPRFK